MLKPLRFRSVSLLLIIFTVPFLTLPIQASPDQVVDVQIRTVNLNREPLAGVTVEVYNATTDPEALVEKGVTNQTGWVRFQLVNDMYYSFKAFWKDEEVGSLPEQSITSNTVIDDFQCSLAHIKVAVIDEAGFPLPYIDLVLEYSYLTRHNETVPKIFSFETRENGTIVVPNMLTNANYTIGARRFGSLFNTTQILGLNQLLKDGWANITITCPTYTLFVHLVDSGKLPLPNVEVEIYAWSSQTLVQSETSNDRGNATFNCTFGRYRVMVYGYSGELKRRIFLNETVVDLIEDQLFLSIHCKIFNITPSVKVVDYFGQPIPDAVIELERRFDQEWVKIVPVRKTDVYGVSSLPKIGGDYRVSVYVTGDLCETRTLYLDETKVLLFKTEKYAMVSGLPIEASRLIVYISLILLITLFGLALSHGRLWQIIMRKKSPS